MKARSEDARAWDRLTDFICDDEGLRPEDIRRELEDDGVDLTAYTKRVNETVRKGLQDQWRHMAEAERAATDARREAVRAKMLSWPLSKLRAVMEKAESGAFGAAGRELAVACRNRAGDEPSPDELKMYVEDILMAAESDKDNEQ